MARASQKAHKFRSIRNRHSEGSASQPSRVSLPRRARVISFFVSATAILAGPPPSLIAFASTRDGNHEIYVMQEDGTNPVRLTFRSPEDISPVLSPDGRKVAFHSHRDGFPGDLHVMNLDGTGELDLTNASSDHETRPSWSPDGKHIAFHRETPTDSDIWRIDPDGTNEVNLSNTPNGHDYGPSYSPDGSKICFFSTRDGNYEIYLMNADGSGQVNLTNHAATDAECVFSPDGDKIAFNSTRDGNYEIYIMNSNGSNQTRLTNHSALDWYPTFSPDGSKIIFVSNRSGDYELYSMNVDGSSVQQLTNTQGTNETPSYQSQGQLTYANVFSLLRGRLVQGGLASLFFQDDSRLVLNPGVVLSPQEAPASFIVEGQQTLGSLSSLFLKVEVSASISNLLVRVEMFDFTHQVWVLVQEALCPATDGILRADVGATPSDFVEAGTGRLRARIGFKTVGPAVVANWQARTDFVGWYARP